MPNPKALKGGSKMETNYDTSVHPDLNGELHTGETNPLYTPEIADHMFQFLDQSDLKNCRSVCRQWNQLAEKILKKLSVVNFSKPERVEEFNQLFPNAQQSQIFTCFRFDGLKWPLYEFFFFCEKWYHNLSEITLIGADFGLGTENEMYDLSPLLPSTLIKLKIASTRPKMLIATDKICNIRVLKLDDCILNIVLSIVLNPVKILLENITFREDGENVEDFLINPLLNFDVLKKASFSGENIMFDLQGSNSLEMLSLQKGITVLNWKTSNWEIKELRLGVYPCNEEEVDLSKSQINYKELEICLSQLNVSLLPEGIEKLKVFLQYDNEVPPGISGEHNFPHLKHLHITLEKGNDFAPFAEYFKNCHELTILTVALPTCDSGEIILKTSSVPPNVKTLRVIYGVRIILDRSLELGSLILYDAHLRGQINNIADIATQLHVKRLIWFGLDAESDLASYGNISDNEKENILKSVIDLDLDTFIVGGFSPVNNSDFENSFLFPLVDTQGRYYLFRRGEKGKAMLSYNCQNPGKKMAAFN